VAGNRAAGWLLADVTKQEAGKKKTQKKQTLKIKCGTNSYSIIFQQNNISGFKEKSPPP